MLWLISVVAIMLRSHDQARSSFYFYNLLSVGFFFSTWREILKKYRMGVVSDKAESLCHHRAPEGLG